MPFCAHFACILDAGRGAGKRVEVKGGGKGGRGTGVR